jgi:hypothetical protein
MKLGERVSWLMGTLQRYLFPPLEECGERPLTGKEQQLASILEVLQIERFNSRMKEEFGGGNVKVRGARKVGLHLMLGVIALFAGQLLKLIS